MDERNDPAAALPARSMASTTATPSATAAATSSDLARSRSAGRTISRKNSISAAISRRHNLTVAHANDRIGDSSRFGAVGRHHDCHPVLVADLPEQLDNRLP